MMIQKRKSLFKGTETTKGFVEKFGYDNKDACHAYRIYQLLNLLAKNQNLKTAVDIHSLNDVDKEVYFKLKEGSFSDADSVASFIDSLISKAKEEDLKNNFKNHEDLGFYFKRHMNKVFEETKKIYGSRLI